MLCHQQWGSGRSEEATRGVEWIDKNVKFTWSPSKLYHHYYMAQAMFEYGGVRWIRYNRSFRDTMLERQNEDGSFAEGSDKKSSQKRGSGIRKHGEGIKQHGDDRYVMKRNYSWKDHYHNCLSTLMLEVYFRYLPGTNERNE